MQGVQGAAVEGFDVKVYTTNHRGFTPEELAERAVEKLISISDTADPMVKAQAMVFQDQIRQLMTFYMHESIRAYKTTLCAQLAKQGHSDMAKIISNL